MKRCRTGFAALAVPLALFALAGCGSGSGDATERSAPVNVYVTDGFNDAYRQVMVTIYKIEVSTDGATFESVFEDAAGRTVDLRSLSGSAELLSSINIPPASYQTVRITFANAFTLVSKEGANSSVTVAQAVGAPAGEGKVAITVETPLRARSGESATLLLDFKLAQFELIGGKLKPHIEAGGDDAVGTKIRTARLVGTISEVTATGFELQAEHDRTLHVTTTDATVLSGGAAPAVGARVLIEGTFDPATNTLTASSISPKPATPSSAPLPRRAGGTVAAVNADAKSFTLTTTRADGFRPNGGTITVVTNAATRFAKGGPAAGAFADIAVGGAAHVGGTFDPATQTLTATVVELIGPRPENPEHPGGNPEPPVGGNGEHPRA